MSHFIFCLFTLIIAGSVQAATLKISEELLVQKSLGEGPELARIEASLLSAELGQRQVTEQFAPEFFGQGAYSETNEKAIIQFIPIWSPVKQAQLGVRQKYAHGLSATAAVSADQRSAVSPIGKYRNITTSTLSFTLRMDIWKDLFGKLSKTQIENADLEAKRAQLERDIQSKAFRIALRRLYWNLVAQEESLKISDELLKTAKKQAEETRRRFQNSVAESDEVARYEAQVATREGSIHYLKFQRETTIKQLKNLLPDLATSELELGEYNIDRTVEEVLACTMMISNESGVPYKYTNYDEIISLIRKIKSNSALINSRYADADISLFGTAKATGVGSKGINDTLYRGSYGSSISDMENNNRTGYELGVQFTLPLGESKANTQKTKELYDEKRLLASMMSTEAQVINTHNQLVKSVNLLTDVVRTSKVSTRELEKRLRYMRRKYEQARVSVTDLVIDQDALLNSQLTTIDVQLQVLNTLFDYLVVFTDTPCTFNRM